MLFVIAFIITRHALLLVVDVAFFSLLLVAHFSFAARPDDEGGRDSGSDGKLFVLLRLRLLLFSAVKVVPALDSRAGQPEPLEGRQGRRKSSGNGSGNLRSNTSSSSSSNSRRFRFFFVSPLPVEPPRRRVPPHPESAAVGDEQGSRRG